MIENPIPTRRALLAWQHPLGGPGRRARCAVAELVQGGDQVSFRYLDQDQLEQAKSAGFSGYPGLPVGSTDLNRIAMDVLMRRLPPRNRGDFGKLLKRFGLPDDRTYSDLSLLAYTGARSTSDSFSVCETFDGFKAPFTYVFDAAGFRYNRNQPAHLEKGEALHFEREPTNEQDPNAIRIARVDGTTVGYVNRLQANVVGQWLDQGEVSASVFRINGRAEYPRLFVRAEIASEPESNVQKRMAFYADYRTLHGTAVDKARRLPTD